MPLEQINISALPETNVDWIADGETITELVLNRPAKNIATVINNNYAITLTSEDIGSTVQAKESVSIITADPNTLLKNNRYFCDTSLSPFNVTLPAVASIGDTIRLNDYAGTFGTNNLTVLPNGNNIMGAASNLVINTADAKITLMFVDAAQGWKIV